MAPEVRLPTAGVRAAAPGPALWQVALVLLGSGACALVYQVAWLRELRLVFGASTPASAAVLAIFMGGLGLGGYRLGPRADRHPRPFALYGTLELAVAAAAAATPLALVLVRAIYVALGGTSVLGDAGATVVRLVLAAIVLGVPTVLMGGTLPAAARAVASGDDPHRRRLAVLYGVNTLGAVLGALLATFVLLEAFGTRTMLWLACALNALLGVTARLLAADGAPAAPPAPAAAESSAAPASFVLAAAAAVGFVFFLMELVWYRMLGPVLGGSSFTFGLILATALGGIAAGGALYAALGATRRPTLAAFATTCTLEAALLALPYALGDRVAVLAVLLRPLESFGFTGLVAGWAVVTGIVVLPAAVVAGYQFPLLVGLLGRGGADLGRHLGLAYAWNTAGSIAGALAGGFGLLPLLGATGTWIGASGALLALGAGAATLALVRGAPVASVAAALPAAAVAMLLLAQTGPTAFWRHSPIGAGRLRFEKMGRVDVEAQIRSRRRAVVWEADGLESSVALDRGAGVALLVNGKSDSNARGDAGTVVMGGLVPAILHPDPRTALVVGLGTGASAGWLAAVPTIERVDVVELERAVVHVARASAPANRDALGNPKVHLVIADAREVLLTTPQRYDVVFSEPSNPFRAGVASLFTREFYEAARARLRPGGVFSQWLQGYEVDAHTVRTVYATLASVFPYVETYQTLVGDLLLLGTTEPLVHDVPRLRARLAEPPFAEALAVAWRTDGLEGFLARHVATPAFARAVADAVGPRINTDDRTRIEFDFARSVGRTATGFSLDALRAAATALGAARALVTGGVVDWERVEDERLASPVPEGIAPSASPAHDAARQARVEALAAFATGQLARARAAWSRQEKEPEGPLELALVALGLAEGGDERALPYVERLRAYQPIEADVATALLRWRQRRIAEAAAALEPALAGYRTNPWPLPQVMRSALTLALGIAANDRAAGERLFAHLRQPFAVSMLEERRPGDALKIAPVLWFAQHCQDVFAAWEPHVPWTADVLVLRVRCYEATRDHRLAAARTDLERFRADQPVGIEAGLQPASSNATTSASPQT